MPPLLNGQIHIGVTDEYPVASGLAAGRGISITPGPGVITVTAINEDKDMHGTHYHYATTGSHMSTHDQTYMHVLSMNMPAITSGTYRLGFFYEWSGASKVRIRVDDINTVHTLVRTGTENASQLGGFHVFSVNGGDHLVDLDLKSSSGDFADIKAAQLEIWKIS